MRGEHIDANFQQRSATGSSPHARGAPYMRHRPGVLLGIIPACAGSTYGTCYSRCNCGDHPRMRGEHGHRDFCPRHRSGSSPHARGALTSFTHILLVLGIIPACAGSTTRVPRTWTRRRDHPRMRGEHRAVGRLWTAGGGSSPHARGAPLSAVVPGMRIGIIPACAGSTRALTCASCPRRDHPRMRGEHGGGRFSISLIKGSSPHARGARRWRAHGIEAGRDHPRMRGEHSRSDVLARDHDGIIPACAGSTMRLRSSSRCRRDHPRMRGEHEIGTGFAGGREGSSPHARGALALDWRLRAGRGIIPACAGSTE